MTQRPIASLNLPEFKIKQIHSKGYIYCEDVDEELLASDAGYSKDEWGKLTEKQSTKTALDILQEEYLSSNVITFSKELDDVLGGGVPTKLITEFTGQTGSGKTQICMQIAASVQLPVCFGGIAGHAVYIDTNYGFTKERFEEISRGCIKHCYLVSQKYESFEMMTSLKSCSVQSLMDGVHYLRTTTFLELLALVHPLRQLLNEDKLIRLLVIDTITKPMKETNLESYEKIKVLYNFLADIQELAQNHNFAIVLTNDLTTKFTTQGVSYVPSLGDSYTHRINNRISLRRISDTDVRAVLEKSPVKASTIINFKITKAGIRDIN